MLERYLYVYLYSCGRSQNLHIEDVPPLHFQVSPQAGHENMVLATPHQAIRPYLIP